MNHDHDLLTLATTFLVLSLFAVGGALSALPEMHRIAVEAQHWMTSSEFADMVAIAQLSPGPNVLVVTLIGYHVAGIAGAVVAITLATACIAWFMRIHPLWAFAAAALLGLAGLI